MKVLRNQASQKDSSDFIREVQNMIELESKQQCPYIIKLRGVAKGRLNFICKVALDKFLYIVLSHVMFHEKNLADSCHWLNCQLLLGLGAASKG